MFFLGEEFEKMVKFAILIMAKNRSADGIAPVSQRQKSWGATEELILPRKCHGRIFISALISAFATEGFLAQKICLGLCLCHAATLLFD